MWLMACDMWHVACDMWHVICKKPLCYGLICCDYVHVVSEVHDYKFLDIIEVIIFKTIFVLIGR